MTTTNTADNHGDLQGIIGHALPAVKTLECENAGVADVRGGWYKHTGESNGSVPGVRASNRRSTGG